MSFPHMWDSAPEGASHIPEALAILTYRANRSGQPPSVLFHCGPGACIGRLAFDATAFEPNIAGPQ